ncbi:MAG: DUF996 domain-containing protein [Aigarchaeota archaeon]|nr:DUF996 domain-containing protein [Candidatus Pelearchaeum maunauluense]
MSSLSQAKALGGVGSILMVLSIAPIVGPLLMLIGLILVLVAVKDIADAVNDETIFRNMLIAVILVVVGSLSIAVFAVGSFFTLATMRGSLMSTPAMGMMQLALATLIVIAVAWALLLFSAIYLRKSYDAIAKALNISMFSRAALIYLIGVALMIIVVGFIIIVVAAILQAVAFFSLPEHL